MTERRRTKRIDLNLPVRYLSECGNEFVAQLSDVSIGGALITSDQRPELGEKIILYIEHLGRIEGRLVRLVDDGFAVRFELGMNKSERFMDALFVQFNPGFVNPDEIDRRFERQSVKGHTFDCEFEDLSRSNVSMTDFSVVGAALVSEHKPSIGEKIRLGDVSATVVRLTDNGFAIEFDSFWEKALSEVESRAS